MEPLPDRLPLVIGVTGHRDLRLSDVPELEQQVASVIEALRRDYLGNDNEVPIIILSALAEGADRLVARVGLAHGCRLIAPLPLPADEYRRDFDPGIVPGNMSEFDELLERAMAMPVMPLGPGISLETARRDADQRRAQYCAAGMFIARHCHVLIALWDGDDKSGSVGGTTEVVRFKREGFALSVSGSVRQSLDISEIGPVIHVVTPRQNANVPVSPVSVVPWGRALVRYHHGGAVRRVASGVEEVVTSLSGRTRPDPRAALGKAERRNLEAWEHFDALAALSRNFNREAAALESSAGESDQIEISLRDLFASADTKPDAEIDAVRKHVDEKAGRWCRLYAIADALARNRQRQVRQDWLAVYALGFVAFLCFALFGLAGEGSNLILLLYCFAFAAIFAVFGRAHMGKHQVHFLDYRALAEALRVAVFFRLAGIGTIAESYPIMQPSELGWVKTCLNALELIQSTQKSTSTEPISTGESASTAGPDSMSESIVREFWVKGQLAFFARGTVRHTVFAEQLENIALVLLAVSPFLIVPMVIVFTNAAGGGSASILREILLLISGLLPGLGTALNGYSDKLALKAQARQYDRMRMLFERALMLLPKRVDAETTPQIRALYAELGAEALKEQAEWVAIYRQRPIEPPK